MARLWIVVLGFTVYPFGLCSRRKGKPACEWRRSICNDGGVTSAIKLRLGTSADVDAMYALDLLCFAEPFRFEWSLMRQLACHPAAVVTVAESEKTLAGFVIANLRRRRTGVAAYIITLDVDRGYRRGGLGRRLMEDAERRCFGAGAERISLHVWTENGAAISFYEALGYGRRARVEGYYGEAGDAWVYRKGLG